MAGLTHLDEQGAAHMVDVSAKAVTHREAVAQGVIFMSDAAREAIHEGSLAKGDALSVARIAGIMAAKQTPALIPLCHPLMLSKVSVEFAFRSDGIEATATVRTSGQTGAEMEAMTAVSVALLTIYDMGKAVDKAMEIGGIILLSKSGGKSGDWTRQS